MSSDPSPRQQEAAAGVRRQAQDAVREWVTSAGVDGSTRRKWVMPLAATAAVAAAACAPVVVPPLLAAVGAAGVTTAVGAALNQVGGVGGGLLAEAVVRAWDRLRPHGQGDAGQAGLRDALATELQAGLTLNTRAAAALRDEVAGVLRGVDAVQVALTATVEQSAAGVREVLVRGLRELGEEFTEFGWVLDEVSRQLAVIAEDVAQTAASTREVADNQQQTLVELAMLRQEARSAFRYRVAQPGLPVPAGLSPDEGRAAALDAAGVPASAECPYLGLAAFQPSDAGRFFGRGQLTAELVARVSEQLARPGLLMVLGPSGSGKSSLLRAGLLPAVAAGALPARGSWAWPRDLMTPGRRPLMELATRIASLAGVPAGALEADLRTDPTRITGAIRQALLTNARRQSNVPGLTPPAGPVLIDPDTSERAEEPDAFSEMAAWQAGAEPRLVLIVDQFEQVFTQCADEQERRTFITALCAAAGARAPGAGNGNGAARGQVDAREAPALVVLGIRADFYARTSAYPELVPHLQDRQVLVGSIGEAGLREVIDKPAAAAGLVVDAALVEALLADIGLHAHRDAAPASAREQPPGGVAVTGGGSYPAGRLALLSYALQQTWANREGRRLTMGGYRATGGIDGAIAQAAERVFSGLDPTGQDALQRVLLRLVTFGEGTPDSRRRADLAELTGSEDSEQAGTTHEVLGDLIFARLVTADADTVEITHETLMTAWPRLHRWLSADRAGLRTHRELTDAARDWEHHGHDPGRLFRGTRLAVARDWAAYHGLDLSPGERAFLAASERDQLRTTRLRRAAVAALAALTVLSATTAGVAIKLSSDALAIRNQAIANQVAAEVSQLTATDPSLAAQLDVAANQINPTPDSKTRLLGTTTTPLASRLTGPTHVVYSVAFSPNGKIVAAGSGNKVWLWNLSNPAHPTQLGQPLTGPANTVYSVAFSPNGKIVAAGSGDQVWLWNLTKPTHPTQLGQPLTGPAGTVNSVAFSHNGRILAAGDDAHVWLWNLASLADPTPLGHALAGSVSIIESVAFSRNGRTLAAGSADHKIWLWNLSNPAHPTQLGHPLTGPANTVYSVAFSPDGKTLAAGSADHKIWLWNLADQAHPTQLGHPLIGPKNTVRSVAFSPDGKTLAAGSTDDNVWLWSLINPAHPTQLGQPLTGAASAVYSVAFSPDGKTLAAGSYDRTVRLWDPSPNVLTGLVGNFSSVAFSPDRKIVAAGSGDRIWLWDLTNPVHPILVGQPRVSGGDVYSVAFSPDGTTLAVGSTDNKAWLWNVTNPAHPTLIGRPLAGAASAVYSVAFTRDGKILAVGSGNQVWLWNVTNPAHPTLIGRPLTSAASAVYSVAFTRDGKILAVGSDNQVWLWNLSHPARPTLLTNPLTGPTNLVLSVAFSRDGKTLAAGSEDNKVWLWNVTNPALPSRLGQLTGPTGYVYSVAFSRDGKALAADSSDGTVQMWNLDVDVAIQRICTVTSNILTPAQWKQYIPQLPYNPPCAHPGRYGLLVH
jgi:WD40 repeat protein